MVVFAVITTKADQKTADIIVVERRQRQLPIVTLSFGSVGRSALEAASDFQAQVSKLLHEKKQKEKLVDEARSKEKIIQLLLQTEKYAASDIYTRACASNNGKPPESWADEVALYVRDHIRDDAFVDILFPNLPSRPKNSGTVRVLNSEKLEVEAERAKRAYENISSGCGSG